MKKKYLIIIVICVLIAAINYSFNNQNVINFYSIPTTSNEPAIPLYSHVLVSNFGVVKKNNFLVFNYNDPLLGEVPHLFRLIATSGDTVQIKKGIVFVNSFNIDQKLTLKHHYKLHFDDFYKIEKIINSTDYFYSELNTSDSLLVFLNDDFAKEYNFKKEITPNNKHNKIIEEKFDEFWNKDEFGPLIIPKDNYFVLGDNRDNAMDSRYIGFIDESKILGIVILGDNN